MSIKSPFKIYRNLLNIVDVESILNHIRVETEYDENNFPISQEFQNNDAQDIIFKHIQHILPDIVNYYDINYKGTHRINFQHFPSFTNAEVSEKPSCQNSIYSRKKWVKVKDIDLTGVLWLSSYNNNPPLDLRYEMYGGKLEFPQYNFSLTPEIGTLVIFPAYPHFITSISKILIGELYQARINIAANKWLYNPLNFPFEKNYMDWFDKELSI